MIVRDRFGWHLVLVCGAIGAVVLVMTGHIGAGLGIVSVVASLAIAALFGISLLPGRVPLIARIIATIDGPERLASPRVARYARVLTACWTGLLVAQAFALGLAAAWPLAIEAPLPWALEGYRAGGSLLVLACFLLGEYAFRRWYLRDVPQLPLRTFLSRLARCWQELVRNPASNGAGHP